MLKRIAPRCDRQYTFNDSDHEFTICPIAVNSKWEIVFWNVNTKNSVPFSLKEFDYLYQNCLVREKEIIPGFLRKKEIRNSEKFYAVARGRLDFFITNKKHFANPLIWDYEGACYGEFDNFGDALDFLYRIDTENPESVRFIETSITETETMLISKYRSLSKNDRKQVRDFIEKLL
ncbi:MAG: hypothetical protein E7360_06665 [Clostridiales bacterium]|nr:hypothetical protein [Clostridiales bacterium]